MNVKISIKEICEFIGRTGHIITEINANNRALEGTKIHQKIQKSQDDTYQAEVSIKYEFKKDEIEYLLQGRIDGVISSDDTIVIDEIKSVTYDIEDLTIETVDRKHLYQVVSYGYIYCLNNDLEQITCRLTYYQVDNKKIKYVEKNFSFNELSNIFNEVMNLFHEFIILYYDNYNKRQLSLKQLSFPYETYREGQQEMMNVVFKVIKEQNKLFINAATGIGKTLGTLYPTLKAMGKGYTNQILYLTAKNITKIVAKETIDLFIDNGLISRVLLMTSKEQICFLDKTNCHPDYCPYAKNHYDRVNNALKDILSSEYMFTKENIQLYANKHQVCPFEFSLDILMFCDIAILDYNYIFDPRVALQRLEGNKVTLLIDESHNLVERARSMYSHEIFYQDIITLKTYIENKSKQVYKTLIELEDEFIKLYALFDQMPYLVDKLPPIDIALKIEKAIFALQKYLSAHRINDEIVLQMYFSFISFMRIYELYDNSFVTYYYKENLKIKIFCIDPKEQLQNKYQHAKGVVFFSATLLPIQYFYTLLGGVDSNYKIYYSSPFEPTNRLVLIGTDVDTRYVSRNKSFNIISEYINKVAASKTGNYLVFFPSYEYLNKVFDNDDYSDLYVYKQTSNMDVDSKKIFLEKFNVVLDKSQVFFAVLGGMFSEGIDFKGDLLIGTIIVGVGLPQLNLERDLIKEYFNEDGYDFAYKYPGMNKVLQAAGRVIRSSDDKGVIILLDQRYQEKDYLRLIPQDWSNGFYTNKNSIIKQLDDFWQKK